VAGQRRRRAGDAPPSSLGEYPPLSAPPAALPAPVWRGAFRLNLPSPPLRPPPDVESASHERAHASGGPAAVTAPMPGTVIRVNVDTGATLPAAHPPALPHPLHIDTPLH